MTTRSGKAFRETEERSKTMTDALMKLLVEDRQKREEQMAQEKEQMQEQIAMLRQLVEQSTAHTRDREERAPASRTTAKSDVKVAKLSEHDDIKAYLVTFERIMQAYGISQDRWPLRLAPQLTDRAQQAYAAMRQEDTLRYPALKEAILNRYNISGETCRRRFLAATRSENETVRDLEIRLQDLMQKWSKDCNTVAELQELIVREQLLNTLPAEVRIWVSERKPKTGAEAAGLADDYLQARSQTKESATPEEPKRSEKMKTEPIRCHFCSKVGHIARDCRRRLAQTQREKADTPRKDHGQWIDGVKCFNCGKKGHLASTCPSNSLFCSDTRKPLLMERRAGQKNANGVARSGTVEGQHVDNILLDTGCSRTLVHCDLVPRQKMLEGEVATIRCAHGDMVLYPLANVELEVNGRKIEVVAAVSETLPMAVLLGTDVPELTDLLGDGLLGGQREAPEDALVVTTRRQTKVQEAEGRESAQKDLDSGAQPHMLDSMEQSEDDPDSQEISGEEDEPEWELGQDFDEDLYPTVREKTRLTRKEKRETKSRVGRGAVHVGSLQNYLHTH